MRRESGKEAAGAAARAGQKPHGSAPWPGLGSPGRGHFLHRAPTQGSRSMKPVIDARAHTHAVSAVPVARACYEEPSALKEVTDP